MVDYAIRPTQIDGCWSSWSEQDTPTIIRTTMENGAPKVRRRFTGVMRTAQVSVVVPIALATDYRNWFVTQCQQGVMPTAIVEPEGREAVWRFMEAPVIQYDAPAQGTATVSARIERLPGWQDL